MHLVNFNTFGYMLSYGIFQEHYSNSLNVDAADVSWVGTVELFLVYFMGAFSGRALHAGYFRTLLNVGLLLQIVGIFTTSIATEYWQLFLAQGVCQGLANGMLFRPAIRHIAAYFSPGRRAFAISCVACGGGTGGLVYPALAQALFPKIGFQWTVRIMGFLVLFNAIIVAIFTRSRLPHLTRAPLVDWSAFRDLSFALFSIGIFLAFWGLYFAYYYARPFSVDILHMSRDASFNVLLVINGAGIPGRVVPALLSDLYIGPVNAIALLVFCGGVLVLTWMLVVDAVGIYIWAAFYGFFGGGIQTLFQTSSTSFSPDDETKLAVRLGMVFTVVSFACLTGTPLAGSLVEAYNGSYVAAQIFCGGVMVLGSLLILAGRLAKTGFAFRVKC